MELSNKVYCGIDVSKNSFDIAFASENQLTTNCSHHPMTAAGLAEAVDQIRSAGACLTVVESTGGYERPLLIALQKAGIDVAVLNPKRVRDFARACGILAKTDRLDAAVIARYAMDLKPPVRPAGHMLLKDLVNRRLDLISMRTAEKNRLDHSVAGQVKRSIRRSLVQITKEIDHLDGAIRKTIRSDHTLESRYDSLVALCGVGPVAASTVIALMPELGRLNRGQAAALAGVAPYNCDSGMMRGKRMTWGGRQAVKNVLFMVALSAIRFSQPIRDQYQRLVDRGKAKKVAIVACMRKLIIIMNAVVRSTEHCSAQCITN